MLVASNMVCGLLRFIDLKSACGVGNLLDIWQLHIPTVISQNALVHEDVNLHAHHNKFLWKYHHLDN